MAPQLLSLAESKSEYDKPVYLIPVSGRVGGKVRPLNFYPHLDRPVVQTRIINFGRCNFRCPFCFRGAQCQREGVVIGAEKHTVGALFEIVDQALAVGEMVKLSGGDPCAEPELSLAIARYVTGRNGRLGMAHNGSDPQFAAQIAPHLEMAAIDIKAHPSKYARIAAVRLSGEDLFMLSLQTISILARANVILDVRTPIFGDTTEDELRFIADALALIGVPSDRLFWTWRLYEQIEGCAFLVPDEAMVRGMIQRVASAFPTLRLGMRVKTTGVSAIERAKPIATEA